VVWLRERERERESASDREKDVTSTLLTRLPAAVMLLVALLAVQFLERETSDDWRGRAGVLLVAVQKVGSCFFKKNLQFFSDFIASNLT